MRSDYVLYGFALVCLILSAFFFIQSDLVPSEMEVIIPSVLVILGLTFVGLGYMMRPGEAVPTPLTSQPIPTTTPTPPPIVESPLKLTMVKGIGPKRAEQLQRLKIGTVENLAKASAKVLSAKTGVSQKVARGWIKEADKLINEAS